MRRPEAPSPTAHGGARSRVVVDDQALSAPGALEFYGALPRRRAIRSRCSCGKCCRSTRRRASATPRSARAARIRALTPDAMWRAPQKKLRRASRWPARTSNSGCGRCAPASIASGATPRLPRSSAGRCRPRAGRSRALPQMGEGGAYRMLLFAADHPVLPVDARVSRVALRLGYGGRGTLHEDRRARSATR